MLAKAVARRESEEKLVGAISWSKAIRVGLRNARDALRISTPAIEPEKEPNPAQPWTMIVLNRHDRIRTF